MDNLVNDKLLIQISTSSNIATIHLHGKLTFAALREFRTAYKKLLDDSLVHHIVVDFEKTSYMDSSALEMLIVLREQVIAAGKSVMLVRPSTFIQRVFDIANFHKLFVIC